MHTTLSSHSHTGIYHLVSFSLAHTHTHTQSIPHTVSHSLRNAMFPHTARVSTIIIVTVTNVIERKTTVEGQHLKGTITFQYSTVQNKNNHTKQTLTYNKTQFCQSIRAVCLHVFWFSLHKGHEWKLQVVLHHVVFLYDASNAVTVPICPKASLYLVCACVCKSHQITY
jgi:hypothetical protein